MEVLHAFSSTSSPSSSADTSRLALMYLTASRMARLGSADQGQREGTGSRLGGGSKGCRLCSKEDQRTAEGWIDENDEFAHR